MNIENFSHAVNQIAAFLSAKEVPGHTKAAWFEKVHTIPDEAVGYIAGKITDEADAMPRNLPKAFNEKYRAWQAEHPEKFVTVVQKGCRDCEAGILWLERKGKDGKTETGVIYCACFVGSVGYLGRSTLVAMQARGWSSKKQVRTDHRDVVDSPYHDLAMNPIEFKDYFKDYDVAEDF